MMSGLWNRGILAVFWHFYKTGIRGQVKHVLLTQEMSIAVLTAVFFTKFGPVLFPDSAKILDIAIGFLGYAAIALGFCVGGMTIALTFPDREFITKLATFKTANRERDALSSLLFVFSWTAVVHWVALVLILAAVLLKGHREGDLLASATLHGRLTVGIVVGFCFYALMQFVITVLTLWQVGFVYIQGLRKAAGQSK